MRMAILHPYINAKGGLERVVLAIAERYGADIYTLKYEKEKTFEGFSSLNITELGGAFKRVLGGKIGLGVLSAFEFSKLRLDGYDVINPHGSPAELCAFSNKRVLWYCHSPNREAFDLYEFRQRRRGLEKYPLAVGFELFRRLDRMAVKRISVIATNSNITKEKIRKYLQRDDARVIHPFIDAKEFRNEGYGKYFLYPSRIVPEKRFEMAIEAFKRAGLKGFKLVIAGFMDPDNEWYATYYEKLKEIARGSEVEFVISPSDEELKGLYAGCRAVLFTPVNEDFGIVPLEAMASEKPVIAIAEGGPTETVVDGKTGFLIKDVEEMAERMRELEDVSLAEQLGKEGRKWVESEFSRAAFFRKFDRAAKEVSGL